MCLFCISALISINIYLEPPHRESKESGTAQVEPKRCLEDAWRQSTGKWNFWNLSSPRSDLTSTISLQVGVVRPPSYLQNPLRSACSGIREARAELGTSTFSPALWIRGKLASSWSRPGCAVSDSCHQCLYVIIVKIRISFKPFSSWRTLFNFLSS